MSARQTAELAIACELRALLLEADRDAREFARISYGCDADERHENNYWRGYVQTRVAELAARLVKDAEVVR